MAASSPAAHRCAPGDAIELQIESLAAGGDGVARAPDGRVVFVPFAAPGDRLRVRVVAERARFLRGKIQELLEPGPGRVAPPCAVFGTCGGCAWQHLDYPVQLAAKARILRDALTRLGGLAAPAEIELEPSPAPYGYRSRARLLVRAGRTGFRGRRSHAPVATSRCPVLVPQLEALLAELAARPPADGEWELVAGADGVRAVPLPVQGGERGGERVELRVGTDRLLVSPGVFAQANAPLLERLAEAVTGAAGAGGLALEAFCGAGLFTLGLARRFERVIAIESSRAAQGDLEQNLSAAGLQNVELRRETLEAALARAELRGLRPDAIVLDPPRAGLAGGSAAALAELGAPRIAYLSCDPATLARDLAAFAGRGYALRAVRGFDLFPQTPHLEALAVLERAGAGT
jgi:23S rRNA (uracil1939-C5)-methyltransferase